MIYTYEVSNSAFVSVLGSINNLILQREITDSGLSDISLFFNDDGYVQFSSLLEFDVAKQSLINSICSNHQGGDFSETSQNATGSLVTANSTTNQEALELDCGLMIGGTYLLKWYGEAKVSFEGDNSVSLVRLLQTINGNTSIIAESCGISEFPMKVGGELIIDLKDGDHVEFNIEVSRGEKTLGPSPTTSLAEIDRTKLFIKPY